jgi:hypothetical protein
VGELAGVGGVGRGQRALVRCCSSGLSASAGSPWIQPNPAAVLGSAGLDRRDAVVFVHPAEVRRTMRRSPVARLEECRLQLMVSR